MFRLTIKSSRHRNDVATKFINMNYDVAISTDKVVVRSESVNALQVHAASVQRRWSDTWISIENEEHLDA